MMKSREEAQSLRQVLSYSKKKDEKDPLMDYLLSFQERMGHAKILLTDKEKTAFLLRHPTRGAAHRRDHAIHRLVQGVRIPSVASW